MTKERKLEILKDLLIQLSDSANILCTCEADERCEVVEECIKSLEQQPCEDCENNDGECCRLLFEKSFNKDYVSRQAVIKALNCEISGSIESDIDLSKYKREFQEFANIILNAQEKTIQSLPPVIPVQSWIPVVNVDDSPFENVQERKVGKWIYHFERDDYNDYENEYYECPFCHDLGGDKYYHYCPVCGNKVKGVEEGSN